jgi:hypothetical protein
VVGGSLDHRGHDLKISEIKPDDGAQGLGREKSKRLCERKIRPGGHHIMFDTDSEEGEEDAVQLVDNTRVHKVGGARWWGK